MTSSAPPPPPDRPPGGDDRGLSPLADRLRCVRVGTRQDLDVTRHLFRGAPAYVVRDPMTLQNHRFDPADYAVFTALDRRRELGDTFAQLVAEGKLSASDEEDFYRFVFRLHQLNFLNLPISNDKLLYERYARKKSARRRQKIASFLFLQVPLINPDAFLERTARVGAILFSRWVFIAWLGLLSAAGYVAATNFHQLLSPLQGVLTAQNLPVMWVTLIVLKLLHEFGHAYACKHFGGYVPEMGAFFIVFTPCAYVDATASWGFTRKRDRLIVNIAGIYVESICAAIAVLVWATTGPGAVRDLAFNVVFLAGIVTVVFNINPLMRFDGYYVASDLLEVPNLRQRSTQYVLSLVKRALLSVPLPSSVLAARGRRLRMLLLSFGVSATLYRLAILIGISTLLAIKLPGVGLVLASLYLGGTAIRLLVRCTRYLWCGEEAAHARRRAIALSLLMLIGLPAAAMFLPVPASVHADGVFGQARESVVRARVSGFLAAAPVQAGSHVAVGDTLAELADDVYTERLAETAAAIEASDIRFGALQVVDYAQAMQEKEHGDVYRLEHRRRQRDLADLRVRAVEAGTVVEAIHANEVGRYLQEGDLVAAIASGTWEIRAILTASELADCRPAVGDTVEIRAAADPRLALCGTISRIAPAGSRMVSELALTHVGGGDIAVNPETAHAQQPYFEVTVDTGLTEAPIFRHGMTARLCFRADAQTVGAKLTRRLLRFINSMSS